MKKVCVFTGTRAEYGQLEPLMRLLDRDRDIRLQILVSGTHLSPEFGLTYKAIEEDGFTINEKVEMLESSDSPAGICSSMGRGLAGYGEAFERLKPSILIIAGDRYEALAAATAAAVCSIPIAHLHGGEITLGATDELYRHAITKLSQLHLAATEEYRQRIIQMGESPDRVFNVGALAVENTIRMELLPKNELEDDLGFKMGDSCLLITFHPATMDDSPAAEQMMSLLTALDKLEGIRMIFTKANADSGGRTINELIDNYAQANPEKAVAFTSLGQLRYLSAMSHAAAVVGNSSSGITEAPAMKTPTVNIGSRQQGRVRAESVIDCPAESKDIAKAVEKALSPEFKAVAKATSNPYFQEETSQKMLEIIKDFKTGTGICKAFHDLPPNPEQE